jgi:hypothetical protein
VPHSRRLRLGELDASGSWQHPWQHPDRPMRPHRPKAQTYRTIWRDSDVSDTRVTRLRAWSRLTGWRFESSSAHRKALHGRAFVFIRPRPQGATRAVATLFATSAARRLTKRGRRPFFLGGPSTRRPQSSRSSGLAVGSCSPYLASVRGTRTETPAQWRQERAGPAASRRATAQIRPWEQRTASRAAAPHGSLQAKAERPPSSSGPRGVRTQVARSSGVPWCRR